MRGHDPGSEHEHERETDGSAATDATAGAQPPSAPPPSFGRSPIGEQPGSSDIPGLSGIPGAPGALSWQPPPAFTAAAAGMRIGGASTGDPPPAWPAATGEPIGEPWPGQTSADTSYPGESYAAEVRAPEEPVHPYFGAPSAPGDVPVWPPQAREAYEAVMGAEPVAAGPGEPDATAELLLPGTPRTTPSADPHHHGASSGPTGPQPASPPPAGPTSPEPASPEPAPARPAPPSPAPEASAAAPAPPAGPAPETTPQPSPPAGFGPVDPGPPADGPPQASSAATLPPFPFPPASPDDSSVRPSVVDPVGLANMPASSGFPPAPTGPMGNPSATPSPGGPSTVAGPFSAFDTGAAKGGARSPQGSFAPPGASPYSPVTPPSDPKSGPGKRLVVGAAIVVAVGAIGTGGYLAYSGLDDRPADPQAARPSAVLKQPEAEPTPTPADDPLSAKRTDPAEMTLAEAFPQSKVSVAGRTYKRVKTNLLNDCDKGAGGAFAAALKSQGCDRLLRATYVDGKHKYAVTTGIAVMPSKEAAVTADAAKDLSENVWFRGLKAAAGSGGERMDIAGGYASGEVRGRYIVFSYATYSDGHTPTSKETDLGPISGGFRDLTAEVLEKRAAKATGD